MKANLKRAYGTITVCEKTYNLKITTNEAVKLEAEIGSDILTGMEKITEIGVLAKFYLAAMKPFNDDINSIEDVYQLFDDYITDGGNYEELQKKILEVLVISGVMTQQTFDICQSATEKQLQALEKLIEVQPTAAL